MTTAVTLPFLPHSNCFKQEAVGVFPRRETPALPLFRSLHNSTACGFQQLSNWEQEVLESLVEANSSDAETGREGSSHKCRRLQDGWWPDPDEEVSWSHDNTLSGASPHIFLRFPRSHPVIWIPGHTSFFHSSRVLASDQEKWKDNFVTQVFLSEPDTPLSHRLGS